MFLSNDGQSVNLDNVEVAHLGLDTCTFELSNGDRVQMCVSEKELADAMGAKVFVYSGRAFFLDNITNARFTETMATVYFTSGRRETIRGKTCVDNFLTLSTNHLLSEIDKAAGEIEAVLVQEDAPVVKVITSEQEGRKLVETTAPRTRRTTARGRK